MPDGRYGYRHHDPCARCTRILAAVSEYTAVHRYPPAYRDIMLIAAVSSQSVVRYHLEALQSRDLVTLVPNRSRSIVITYTGIEAVKA